MGLSLGLYGEWAQSQIDLILSLLAPGDIFVDVGSGIGVHARAAYEAVGPTGAVLALEPSPRLFSVLERNAELCPGAIRCVQTALGDAVDRLPATAFGPAGPPKSADPRPGSGSRSEEERVAVVPLDDLELQKCSVIRIAPPHYSSAVIRGAGGTLDSLRPVVLVELGDLDVVAQALSSHHWSGYTIFVVQSRVFNPDNYRDEKRNVFGWAQEASLLFVPEHHLKDLPRAHANCSLTKVTSLHQAAQVLVRTAQREDSGPHERDSEYLRATLNECEAELKRARFRTHALEKRVSELLTSLEEQEQRLRTVTQTLTGMANSRSWRLTAPLRTVRKRRR